MRKIQIAGYGIESAELPEDSEVLMQEGDNLEEATEALEAFAILLQPAVEGYAVNPAALAAVSTVTNRLVRKAGLPTLSVGTESLVVDTVQQAASLGLEDIKEHIVNAAKATKDIILKIFKWVAEKFKALGSSAKTIAADLKSSLEKIKDISSKMSVKLTPKKEDDKTVVLLQGADKEKEIKVACDMRHFYVNGKVSSDALKTLGALIDQIWAQGSSYENINKAITELDSSLEKEEGDDNWVNIRNKFNVALKIAAKDAYGLTDTGEFKNGLGYNKLTLDVKTQIDSPTESAVDTTSEPYPEATQSVSLKDLGFNESIVTQLITYLADMEKYATNKMQAIVDSADHVAASKFKESNHSRYNKDDGDAAWMRQQLRVTSAAWRDIHKYRLFDSRVITNMLGTMRELNKLVKALADV